MTALVGIAAVYFVLYGRSEQASSGGVEQKKLSFDFLLGLLHQS